MPTIELTCPARVGELFERDQFIDGFAFVSFQSFEVWHAQLSLKRHI
jgi:hypothetical protein